MEEFNKSIDFSFENETKLENLLENVSSSHSANISFSFENDDDIITQDNNRAQFSFKKDVKNLIPDYVK